MSFSVGPGVAEAIAADGGEARSDERFVILDPGRKVSMTFATTGVYYWYEEDNRTYRSPFDQGEQQPSRWYDPWTEQPPQWYDFSCSACSLDWLKRSMALVTPDDIYASREATTYEIGYGQVCGGGVNLTPSVGLCNADGSALRAVLRDYGVATDQAWLDFDTAYSIATMTPGMCSGASWYHWVGIRGVQGDTIWVANSAPGYKSIWSNLSRSDWDRLGGFSCVWVI